MNESSRLFKSVLIVEDEAAHALLIERALRTSVEGVVRAGSVAEANRKLADCSFDLIISDLHLPDSQADDVVVSLTNAAPGVPIIVLTSSASVSEGVAAMRAGARDFLVKNFDETFKDVLHLSVSRLYRACEAERERARLESDRDLLRVAIENSDDGLAVAGRTGAISYCNSSFEDFLSSLSLEHRNLLEVSSSLFERGADVMASLRERFSTLQPGAVWTTELVFVGPSEAAFDLSVSAVASTGESSVLVLWLRDIRERRRRERFQRDILSTTTHDLKGPLGAISISCDVLLERRIEDQRATALLERIAASASSAIHLIEEFLSVRRIEEGSFVMRPARQSVRPLIDRVVDTFKLTAGTRGIDLAVDVVDEDVLACCDPLAFERVVSNLVSNALKFTPRGGRVVLSAEHRPQGTLLRIADTGCGMEPAEAQRLFQRYSRLTRHSDVHGTGLGLFIVKNILSAHGGTIEVTSAPGRGTSFDIFFPDAPPINERGEVLCLDFA